MYICLEKNETGDNALYYSKDIGRRRIYRQTYPLFKLWAVMEKDNISIRTLMEREMSGYYDSKIESEEQKYE